MYGHIKALADAEKKGVEKAGVTVDVYQLPETLSDDVLAKMHAPPKASDVPVLSDPSVLESYDGFLFGIPTRYGNFPAQWKVSCIPPAHHTAPKPPSPPPNTLWRAITRIQWLTLCEPRPSGT